MNINLVKQNEIDIAIITSSELLLFDVQSELDLIGNVQYQSGSNRFVISKCCVSPKFFDLSTGLAGDMLQKFVNYQVKLAIVGDFSEYASKSLHDFIRESNCGNHIFFVASQAETITKLANAKNMCVL